MRILSTLIFLLLSISGSLANLDTSSKEACALTFKANSLQHVNLTSVTEFATSFRVAIPAKTSNFFSLVFTPHNIPSNYVPATYKWEDSGDVFAALFGIQFDLASKSVVSYYNFPSENDMDKSEPLVDFPSSGDIYFWIEMKDNKVNVYFSTDQKKPATSVELPASFVSLLKTNERLYVGILANYELSINNWQFVPCLPLPALVDRFGQTNVAFDDFRPIDLSLGNKEFSTFFQWELNSLNDANAGFSFVLTSAPFPASYSSASNDAGWNYLALADSVAISLNSDGGDVTIKVQKYVQTNPGIVNSRTETVSTSASYWWFHYDLASQKVLYKYSNNLDEPKHADSLALDLSDIFVDGVAYAGFVNGPAAFQVKAWSLYTASQVIPISPLKLLTDETTPLIIPPWVVGIKNFVTFYADLNNADLTTSITTDNSGLFLAGHEPTLDANTGAILFKFDERASGSAQINVMLKNKNSKRYDVNENTYTAHAMIQKCETRFTQRTDFGDGRIVETDKKITCHRYYNAQCDEFRLKIVDYRDSDEFQPGDVFADKYLDCNCVLQPMPELGAAEYVL